MKIIAITSPDFVPDEAAQCNLLFAYGLECLHLRKPGADRTLYEQFILQIAPDFKNRIVLHDHYDLVVQYQLHGIHLRSGNAEEYIHYTKYSSVSISCHSVEEIRHLPFRPAYCFLSPVFDSISKPGYQGHFNELADLKDIEVPVIALGGISPSHLPVCRQAGFSGVAVLGYLWEKPEEILPRFRQLITPCVLSIAGFDPSSGAGVTADLKSFETTGSYGFGVCTSITFQNEDSYMGTKWLPFDDIEKQCNILFEKYLPSFIKIGLIESVEVLDKLTDYLVDTVPNVKIVWDPILKATAGQHFHDLQEPENRKKLQLILSRLYLITPNSEEVKVIFGDIKTAEELQLVCKTSDLNILWKGGHDDGVISMDRLITGNAIHSFSVCRSKWEKHGTGCIVSSALLSYLAQGASLPDACNKAQLYVSRFIDSNISRLGFHNTGIKSHKPSLEGLTVQYITARKEGMSLTEQVETICRGGMRWIQLRMKNADTEEFLEQGILIKEICRRHNALFIINDRVDIARQLDADGVHLGKEDMDPQKARELLGDHKIIGATCNTWEDIRLRHAQKVDYIGLGPFTFTTTKEKLSPVLGVEGYTDLLSHMYKQGIHFPVFAIGGITETDIPALLETGVRGIALSGLIKNSADLSRKTADIIALINNHTISHY